jgi:CTP synthase
MPASSLALVGDYSPAVIAHRAIPQALALAAAATGCDVTWTWIHTDTIRDAPRDLATFSALWIVPASPYANMAGVLAAIRWARETKRPVFGSCGGFQHMLIEFARHVAGIVGADHTEIHPQTAEPVIAPLECSLVGQTEALRLAAGSRMRAAYGRDIASEDYHCRYGLNPTYRARIESAGLRFTAFDDTGAPRAAELANDVHPFFLGTLFQPERAALRGAAPPLACAFVHAAAFPL